MRIYLDVCCYSRLYDDQGQSRVRLEADSIRDFLEKCRSKTWTLVSSIVVAFEVLNNPDEEKRQGTLILLEIAKEEVDVDSEVEHRSSELRAIGFKEMDSLHIACAEKAKADVFLTTDDGIVRRAKQYANQLKIRIENPLVWCIELGEDTE